MDVGTRRDRARIGAQHEYIEHFIKKAPASFLASDFVPQASNGQTVPEQECDDLKEIVGVGKAFEQTLHDLGVFSYRQIARFGMSDIARVNLQLKEFKGRMEQDDWIGQAKELLFKKYG